MASYWDIKKLELVNDVDENKVEKIKQSIIKNGWQGCPILYTDLGLVTGSHRLEALKKIEKEEESIDILDENVAEDVSDIINEYCEENGIYWDEIDFSNLRDIFTGTWV